MAVCLICIALEVNQDCTEALQGGREMVSLLECPLKTTVSEQVNPCVNCQADDPQCWQNIKGEEQEQGDIGNRQASQD